MPKQARPRQRTTLGALGIGLATLAGIAALLVAGLGSHPAAADARHASSVDAAHQLLAAQLASDSSTTPAAPTGSPSATMTAPADGSTVAAGAVALSASLSSDLVSALQAGSGGACYFAIGDDAGSTANGTLDLTAGTCTASWTFSYAADYTIAVRVSTPAGTTYSSSPVTLTVTGGGDARCSGAASATCSYRWVEVYYTWSSDTRHVRVCTIDGGCLWATAHTSWLQVTGADYWINSTGQQLSDGNAAEAYLCIGSAPANWTSYSSDHDFDRLVDRPETSTAPVPSGTC